ncbi:hypothetical protein [Poseidonocella sp. HB161398]|uniref:hypothetical protein n=1 Tax=Poseidonocella sp. HB161398 TaxID=2320855 RepID=UPI001108DEDC|nr:hypothetical protein [Poseidonocella sp. HB161398]
MQATDRTFWAVEPCDAQLGEHVPGRLAMEYGTDQSGRVSYRFNSAGFRGEDYDPDARIRICVIGESQAFGTGLHEELIFGNRVADHLAAALDVPREEVNLLNLSVGGASSDYVTRMVLKHVPGLEFDLVLLAYPQPQRMEHFNGETYEQFDLAALAPGRQEGLPRPLRGYRDLNNDHLGRIAMLKNVLLAQGLMEHARIPYVIATEFLRPNLQARPYLAPFLGALDDRWVLRHRCFVLGFDRAADGVHGGAMAHGALAISMLPVIAAQFERHGEEDAVDQLTTYHRYLTETDPDWHSMRRAVREARERALRT